MQTLTLPVARVQQGNLTLFSTAIEVKTLIQDGFYSVETLDPSSDSGYQRLLSQARARKLADYIIRGQDNQDAFLPTSVFLATDKSLRFDSIRNEITFNPNIVGPFSVVDGQHRLEGLKMAAKKNDRVLDFALPVNIAGNLPKLHQMCHFLIVNTTQKSVDKAVEQRIIARLTEMVDVEEIPSLPKWIQHVVEKGEVNKALKMVTFLNENQESPWFSKITMANESKNPKQTINQRSFVRLIERHYLTANNPIEALNDPSKERKIFLNYWKAIADLIGAGSASVLYKYNGVDLFCRFSVPFFIKLQNEGRFTVAAMTELLSACFDNIEGEFAGVRHAQWWVSGGTASGLHQRAGFLIPASGRESANWADLR